MTQQLLTAVFPGSLKDEVVDALIALEDISGFSLCDIDGYSREHSQYDIAEQVAGYRRMCRLEVMHLQAQQDALLSALAQTSAASHLRYWISPVLASGTLGGDSAH